MSFASVLKDELVRIIPQAPCCRAAEIRGLGHLEDHAGGAFRISMRSAALARKMYLLLKETGASQPALVIKKRGQRRIYELSGYIGGHLVSCLTAEQGEGTGLPERRCCRRALLRGIFLTKGSVTDPDKSYHLEIISASLPEAQKVAELFALLGVPARISKKRRNYAVYLKDGDQICQFFRLVEAHQSLLKWENVRIIKDMKNTINRLVNAETANVDKTVQAAVRQAAGISFLSAKVGLENLPLHLRCVARRRLEMPYASLQELAESMDPPISKSAVNYRLRRLLEMAESAGFTPEPESN
ncbi:MAG TPA: DNA-binding protein WhiA [Firmicutes bacterium]|nr:DNA-binding protein WhiA [Bacillota bacterium]